MKIILACIVLSVAFKAGAAQQRCDVKFGAARSTSLPYCYSGEVMTGLITVDPIRIRCSPIQVFCPSPSPKPAPESSNEDPR